MNRGTLLKLAKAGRLVAVGSYHFDDMTGSDRMEPGKEFPVRVRVDGEHWSAAKEGVYNLWESDFRSSCGSASISDDGKRVTLYVHSNCNYTFRIVGEVPKPVAIAKAHRPENVRMAAFLKANGIDAVPKYLAVGSMRGCWRLYNKNVKWSMKLAAELNALGFVSAHHEPLGEFSGNGGDFCVCVRGHNELLADVPAAPAPAAVPATAPAPVAPVAAAYYAPDKPLVMPKTDKEGLLNQVRMIQTALAHGEVVEVALQLAALLDDLNSSGVVFKWNSHPLAAYDPAGVAAACAACYPNLRN